MDLIDYTYDHGQPQSLQNSLNESHTGRQDLLPKSISGIVKDMMTRVGVVMPPNAKPISILET
jgi:hypothetical protein